MILSLHVGPYCRYHRKIEVSLRGVVDLTGPNDTCCGQVNLAGLPCSHVRRSQLQRRVDSINPRQMQLGPAMPSKRAIGILRARQAKSQPLAPYSFTTEPLGFDLFVSDLKILALAIALRLSLYPPSSHPPAEV